MNDARPKQELSYDPYIRLISKSTGSPAKYSWVEVYRDTSGQWISMTTSGTFAYDPAYEYNNTNATLNSVVRAHRDPRTGQLLFFFRRRQTGCPFVLFWKSLSPELNDGDNGQFLQGVTKTYGISSVIYRKILTHELGDFVSSARALLEYDCFAKKFRIFPTFNTAYNVTVDIPSQFAGTGLQWNDIEWRDEGFTGTLYSEQYVRAYYYQLRSTYTNPPRKWELRVDESCSSLLPLASGRIGKSVQNILHTYNKVLSTGHPRLSALATYLNSPKAKTLPLKSFIDPYIPNSGLASIPLIDTYNTDFDGNFINWEFYWTDSNGAKITEANMSVALAWSTTPIDSGSFGISVAATLPPGQPDTNNAPSPGVEWSFTGNVSIASISTPSGSVTTTSNITGVTCIPPANSTFSIQSVSLTSTTVKTGGNPHALIKGTFIDDSIVWPAAPSLDGAPIPIDNLKGKHFYIYTPYGANTPLGVSPILGSYWKKVEPGQEGSSGTVIPRNEDVYYFNRMFMPDVYVVMKKPVSDNGAFYNVFMIYSHQPVQDNHFPQNAVQYRMDAAFPELPFVVGANVTASFAVSPSTSFSIGRVKLEVLEV